MKRCVLFLAILAVFISATMAFADEGMWPYNLVPKDKIKAKYGVDLSPQPAPVGVGETAQPVYLLAQKDVSRAAIGEQTE